ncbi:hypothetical protein BKI52_30535 [marine bacterium AO1-C]|nr:hypothetical protein BKI52_30535 [marine bacterium AO1-C]
MNKQDIKEFIPSAIIIGLFINALIQIKLYNYLFGPGLFFGYALFVIVLISFFVNRKFYRYSLGFLLIMGSINLITFTPAIHVVGFYFKMNIGIKLDIGVQPISSVLLLVYYAVYCKQLKVLWSNTAKNNPKNSQEVANTQVIQFKKTFASKNNQELQTIVDDNDRVPAAIQAAKELLEERK